MALTTARDSVAGAATTRARPADTSAPQRRSALAELLERPLTSYYLLLGATSMLLVLGMVMVLSASSVDSYRVFGSSFSVFQKQALWCGIGIPLLWITSRLPVRVLRGLAYPALIGALALLSLVPVMGHEVNGNRNWIDFGGPLRIQPSEFAKLAIILWGADLLSRKTKMLTQWRHLLVPLLPVAGLLVALVMTGRDLGTSIVLLAIVAALIFFAGAPMRLFMVLSGAGAAVVLGFVVTSVNRTQRVLGFLDPSSNLATTGYQLQQSKFALGSGGWFGVGLGASREKWGALPEQHTDFIFAVVGEELGLLGTVAVLLLFGALAYAGVRIAMRTTDCFIRLAAAGITTWLSVQALINLGAVLGLLPIMGIPLPLVSYGGSALLPTLLGLGMLLCFARHEDGAEAALAARRRRRPASAPASRRPR